MAKVNNNADDYASSRVGIFFTANNETPADGNLTGQCVTLNKWFLAEMTNVPLPFSARGHARYVGDTLVNQGHAVEVPYEQRRRGDFVIYKYGTYGHIGVLLSGDRLFEQNANVGNVARRVVDGAYVYASRIGSLNESWRPVRPNIYRIKSYSEEDSEVIIGTDQGWYDRMNRFHHQLVMNADLSQVVFKAVQGRELAKVLVEWSDHSNAQQLISDQELGEKARREAWGQKISDLYTWVNQRDKVIDQNNLDLTTLRNQIAELEKRPTTSQLEAIKATIADYEKRAAEAQAETEKSREELAKYKEEDAKTENAVIAWIKAFFRISSK